MTPLLLTMLQSTASADAAARIRAPPLLWWPHPVIRLPTGRGLVDGHVRWIALAWCVVCRCWAAVTSSHSVAFTAASEPCRGDAGQRVLWLARQRKQASARLSPHSLRSRPTVRLLPQENMAPGGATVRRLRSRLPQEVHQTLPGAKVVQYRSVRNSTGRFVSTG